MVDGLKYVADGIKNIPDVHRIYIAMLGETNEVHMHYHLFPRYKFEHDSKINEWAEKHQFKNGSFGWQKFYSEPTLGFKSFTGFQYLGEIEKSYDITKKRMGNKPPEKELLEEIAEKVKKICKL